MGNSSPFTLSELLGQLVAYSVPGFVLCVLAFVGYYVNRAHARRAYKKALRGNSLVVNCELCGRENTHPLEHAGRNVECTYCHASRRLPKNPD